jgi:hypothetical protein
MSVKIALLKSGESVIADIKELVCDDEVRGYLFENPHKIGINKSILLTETPSTEVENSIDVTLSPWILLTLEDKIAVPKDWIVTVVEPIKSIIELYEEKVNGKNSKVSSTES